MLIRYVRGILILIYLVATGFFAQAFLAFADGAWAHCVTYYDPDLSYNCNKAWDAAFWVGTALLLALFSLFSSIRGHIKDLGWANIAIGFISLTLTLPAIMLAGMSLV